MEFYSLLKCSFDYSIINTFLNIRFTTKTTQGNASNFPQVKIKPLPSKLNFFIYFSSSKYPDDLLVNKLLLEKKNTVYHAPNEIEQQFYLKNQEQILKKIDIQFWKEITVKKSFFYSNYDLYEFPVSVPFKENL